MDLKEAKQDQFIIDFCKSMDIKIEDINCYDCLDGEMYPQYGQAPHKGIAFNILPEKDWPENFEPDADQVKDGLGIMQGTYYCINKKCENSKK